MAQLLMSDGDEDDGFVLRTVLVRQLHLNFLFGGVEQMLIIDECKSFC